MLSLKKKCTIVILLFFASIDLTLSFASDSINKQIERPLLQIEGTSYDIGIIQKGEDFGHEHYSDYASDLPEGVDLIITKI